MIPPKSPWLQAGRSRNRLDCRAANAHTRYHLHGFRCSRRELLIRHKRTGQRKRRAPSRIDHKRSRCTFPIGQRLISRDKNISSRNLDRNHFARPRVTEAIRIVHRDPSIGVVDLHDEGLRKSYPSKPSTVRPSAAEMAALTGSTSTSDCRNSKSPMSMATFDPFAAVTLFSPPPLASNGWPSFMLRLFAVSVSTASETEPVSRMNQ